MHPLRQFISQYTPVPEQDWQAISACLIRRELKKETLLLEDGKTCKHLYFLEKGLLRFFVWKDGLDITKYFTDVPYVLPLPILATALKPGLIPQKSGKSGAMCPIGSNGIAV